MRGLTDHRVNELNEALNVYALDGPGPGGASHQYAICDSAAPGAVGAKVDCRLDFQNGPIKEAGVNGISIEALLAICADRLRGFQSGEYATRENACAITKIEEAQMWLLKRTREREQRGVKGTLAK